MDYPAHTLVIAAPARFGQQSIPRAGCPPDRYERAINIRNRLIGVLRVGTGQFVPFLHGDPPPRPEGEPVRWDAAPLLPDQTLHFPAAPARPDGFGPIWMHYRPAPPGH